MSHEIKTAVAWKCDGAPNEPDPLTGKPPYRPRETCPSYVLLEHIMGTEGPRVPEGWESDARGDLCERCLRVLRHRAAKKERLDRLRAVVAAFELAGLPGGVVQDYPTEKVYWTDEKNPLWDVVVVVKGKERIKYHAEGSYPNGETCQASSYELERLAARVARRAGAP